MTREQRIRSYLNMWQNRLGLLDWDIQYNPERKPDADNAADSSMQNYMRLCEIGIQPDCPDSELEACVLHELLHITTAPLVDKAHAMAGALGGKRTGRLLMDEAHDLEERLIEQLVSAFTGRKQRVWGEGAKHLASFTARDAA